MAFVGMQWTYWDEETWRSVLSGLPFDLEAGRFESRPPATIVVLVRRLAAEKAEMSATEVTDPGLAAIAARLKAVHALLQRAATEAGQGTMRGAEALIERYRPEVYAAMDEVGLAAEEFRLSAPSPERLAAAQALLIGELREIWLTSPIAFYGSQRKHRRASYFELIEHIRQRPGHRRRHPCPHS